MKKLKESQSNPWNKYTGDQLTGVLGIVW